MSTIINFALEEIEDAVNLLDEQEEVIENELTTNARVIDTVSAMEALLDTLEGKETLSLEEMRLINIAGQFGATGTDAKAEDIVPSMESLKDVGIATEGILESIQNGIASIAASNKAVMWAIEKRLAGLGTIIKAQEMRMANIKKAIEGVDKDNNKALFILKLKLPSDSPIKNKRSFMEALKRDTDGVLEMVKIFVKNIDEVNAGFFKVVGSFRSGDSYNQFLADSFTSYNNDLMGGIVNSKFLTNKLSQTSSETETTLNNKVITAAYSDKKVTKISGRTYIRNAIEEISIGIYPVSSYKEADVVKHDIEIHDFTLQDMNTILKCLQSTVDALKIYHKEGQIFSGQNRDIGTSIVSIVGYIKTNMAVNSIINSFEGLVGSLAQNKDVPKQFLSIITGLKNGMIIGTSIGGALLTVFLNWLRKTILAWMFTTLKLQYKITRTIAWFDKNLVELNCGTFDIGMKPLDMAAKRKSWE